MKGYILLSSMALILLLSGCGENPKAIQPGQADSSFQRISEDFLTGFLAWRPDGAVSLGFHEYDGKMTDFSKGSLETEINRLRSYKTQLDSLDTLSLSPRVLYDYRILRSGINYELFKFEDFNPYAKNPMQYAGALDVSIYVKRNFAPLEDRVRSIIRIEEKAPELFAAARANLEDSLAEPYIQTAIEVANGAAGFLGGDLLIALKELKNDTLMARFKTANQKAIDEIKGYVAYLKKEKMPKAHNHYGIGPEKFQRMLAVECIHESPEKVLETGLIELKKEQDAFNAAAKIINPNKKPIEVYNDLQKEHPVADSLIPDAKKNLEGIRQYLLDKNIVTMPSEVRVHVQETPEFARATSTASMDTPGPFEKKATEAYYYITPVDPHWTAKQKEDWLSQFNFYTTDIVTIHEVYPGHYTQFLHLNASSATKIEKIFGRYAYIEGWAHYTEQMMIEEGYGNTGDSVKAAKLHLAQSGDALLRLCRLCVSIKTHCQGISVGEATKFFMDNWHQGNEPSREEALRGTFDPGYCFYSLGKLQILKLRADYKKQEGDSFSLKHFHDLMLDNGMPPIRLLREILLKDSSQWDKIL
jgi:uncharacterized protein (DUF885 family)